VEKPLPCSLALALRLAPLLSFYLSLALQALRCVGERRGESKRNEERDERNLEFGVLCTGVVSVCVLGSCVCVTAASRPLFRSHTQYSNSSYNFNSNSNNSQSSFQLPGPIWSFLNEFDCVLESL